MGVKKERDGRKEGEGIEEEKGRRVRVGERRVSR